MLKKSLTIITTATLLFSFCPVMAQEADVVFSVAPDVVLGIEITPGVFDFGLLSLGTPAIPTIVNTFALPDNTLNNLSGYPMAISVKGSDATNDTDKIWTISGGAGTDAFAVQPRYDPDISGPNVLKAYIPFTNLPGNGSIDIDALFYMPTATSGLGAYSFTLTFLATAI